MLNRILLVVLMSCALGQVAAADDLTDAKAADIRRLMEITGAANLGVQFGTAVSRQMFQALKAARPDVSDRAMTVIEKEINSFLAENISTPGGLVDRIIPIYSKYYSQKEIRELLAFYQSPIGKKIIQVSPKVASESMGVGQQWGQSLGPEFQKRVTAALKREGLIPGDKAAGPTLQ